MQDRLFDGVSLFGYSVYPKIEVGDRVDIASIERFKFGKGLVWTAMAKDEQRRYIRDSAITEARRQPDRIVVDTREKAPYTFASQDIEVKYRTLTTGDYAVDGHEGTTVVERKTKNDFLRSITHDRDRFEAELERAGQFLVPMAIVVEATWSDFESGYYTRMVHINSIKGTVETWQDRYNIEWRFVDGREQGEATTYGYLKNTIN